MEQARNGTLAAVFASWLIVLTWRERYVRGVCATVSPPCRSERLHGEIIRDPDNVRTDHEIASCQARIAGVE
jgi:hypothetical protein